MHPPRSRHVSRAESGFTLVELMVATAISGIVSGLLFSVFVTTVNFTKRGAAEVEAQQVVRIALSQMVKDLREAHAAGEAMAIWPEADGEWFHAIGFVSARQEVGGRPFETDRDGNPDWQTAIYYVHDRQRGELRRIAKSWDGTLTVPPTGEGRVVARGVKYISIARREDLVTIAFVINVGRRESRLETAVHLRNQ